MTQPVDYEALERLLEAAKVAEATWLPPQEGLNPRRVEAANQRAYLIATAIRALAPKQER